MDAGHERMTRRAMMFGTDRGATSAVGFYPTSYSEPNRINNNRRFAPVRSVERGGREGAWQRRGNATLRHICAEVRSLGKSHSSENGRRKFDRAIPRTPPQRAPTKARFSNPTDFSNSARPIPFRCRFCDGNQSATARRRQLPAPPQHLATQPPMPMSVGQLPRSQGSHQTVRTVSDRRI
jgi:hypothetical protein